MLIDAMCRNIRVLHGFAPPTTPEEIRAAALQYVRKVSGLPKPPRVDLDAFDRAIDEITHSTERLLAALHPRIPPRTREAERERARLRWKVREARLSR
jgi:hypothetical protein